MASISRFLKAGIASLSTMLMLAGCVNKNIEVSQENAITVCLDEANLTEEEVENLQASENNGYTIEYDHRGKHFTFDVSKDGRIKSRTNTKIDGYVEPEKSKKKKHEEPDEDTLEVSENSLPIEDEFSQNLVNTAIANAGLTKEDISDISLEKDINDLYIIRFKNLKTGNIVRTTADRNGHLLSSVIEAAQ